MYTVKEIYTTLQGEGAHTGRAAVFLRFAGGNLWSGLERDRGGAACQFCDTDFVGTDGPGGGKFAEAGALADAVAQCWEAAVESPPHPVPLPKGRGVCAPPSSIAEQGRPIATAASDSLSPRRERAGVRGARQQAGPYVVCTGGEPLLQLDEPLIEALHAAASKSPSKPTAPSLLRPASTGFA